MRTEKLYINSENYEESISAAADILKSCGIVAIPTETVYGLAASAYDNNAIDKVFIAKGRPQDNPLIVHISNMDMLHSIVYDIPEKALECAEKFWPGPLTMIFKKKDIIASSVSAGLDTVAVRMPAHKVALDIISKANLPLAAPSANTSGKPSPTSALHVELDLFNKINAIVYADECEFGVESTVVSFCCNPPRLLRPGAVTVEQLKEIIPDIIVDSSVLKEPQKDMKVESPGVKYKHYSPNTECYLVEGSKSAFAHFVNKQENSVAVCFSEEAQKISVPKLVYGNSNDELTLAHKVFSVLRDVDSLGLSKAYIHAPSKCGVGLAVYNRLLRACGFKVINLTTVIGLTGPTGAGKSTISLKAEKLGYKVIDCDKLARLAVEKGSKGLSAIVKAFSEEILNDDGTLNRKALAKVAFSSKENTEILNTTLLPFIVELVENEIEGEKVLLDAPTLFESGINNICSATIAVLADKDIRLDRIKKRDNIDTESALLRINAGKTDDFYESNADFVVYNNFGDSANLKFEEILLNEI